MTVAGSFHLCWGWVELWTEDVAPSEEDLATHIKPWVPATVRHVNLGVVSHAGVEAEGLEIQGHPWLPRGPYGTQRPAKLKRS